MPVGRDGVHKQLAFLSYTDIADKTSLLSSMPHVIGGSEVRRGREVTGDQRWEHDVIEGYDVVIGGSEVRRGHRGIRGTTWSEGHDQRWEYDVIEGSEVQSHTGIRTGRGR